MDLATSERCGLAWKRSTIWMASGQCSVARFQIHLAPSPSTARRAARPPAPRGGPPDVLGGPLPPGQFVEPLVALLEADHRAHPSDHAQHARRQRPVLQTERVVARAEARLAGLAGVVGAR